MENRRKSTRLSKPVIKYTSGSPNKRKKNQKSELDDNPYNCETLKEEVEKIAQSSGLPSELFSQDDVDGKTLYPLTATPTRKGATLEAVRKYQSPQVNLKNCIKKQFNAALPKIVLKRADVNGEQWKINGQSPVKENKSITRMKTKSINCSNSTDTSCSDNETEDSNFENKENKSTKTEPSLSVNGPSKLRSGRFRINQDYHLQTDEYFAKQSEKCVTSNNTLGKLKHRHLDEEKLQELLAKSDHISKEHRKCIKIMSQTLEMRYNEWMQLMEEGFSVLLYGLGSKRLLINNFYKKVIPDEPTLIINGFFPSLTIKEILDNIIVELLGLPAISSQSECIETIVNTMKAYPDDRIYLLINNIDGGMLRSVKAQDILSQLASIPNIHLLASVDHINAPLVWDNVMRSRYNFYWMNATTFLPYQAETSYESSLLIQKSGALALLSLQNVFASLTSNAKTMYKILVKYQLENGGNNYNGMAFKDLYQASREAFIASSDLALRAQLTEFVDHKLVKTKRTYDGIESLVIPLDDALLKQFLEQQGET